MKEKELRKFAICIVCKKPFGHTGLPLFWRLTIERHGVNRQAIQRQDGLAALLGGSSLLAQVMGPDEEMTTPMVEPITVTVCEKCAMEPQIIGFLAEAASDERKKHDDAK